MSFSVNWSTASPELAIVAVGNLTDIVRIVHGFKGIPSRLAREASFVKRISSDASRFTFHALRSGPSTPSPLVASFFRSLAVADDVLELGGGADIFSAPALSRPPDPGTGRCWR